MEGESGKRSGWRARLKKQVGKAPYKARSLCRSDDGRAIATWNTPRSRVPDGEAGKADDAHGYNG